MLEEYCKNNWEHYHFVSNCLKEKSLVENLSGIYDLISAKTIKTYLLRIENDIVGFGLIIPLNFKNVEIRYYIMEKYRGEKYSEKLISLLLGRIDKNTIVYADIQNENIASKKAALFNNFFNIRWFHLY